MRTTLAALILLATVGCADDSGKDLFPTACHLPSPEMEVDMSLVPDVFIVHPQTVVRSVSKQDGLLVIAMNIPSGVTDLYERYLDALSEPDYELINSENEGFEAEMYWREASSGRFLAVQLRNPGCQEAVAGFVTLGKIPDPVGKGAGG